MKCKNDYFKMDRRQSLSARRAWIEILANNPEIAAGVSLSARRAWIEIVEQAQDAASQASLSARRAWIEISHAAD